MSRLRKIPGVTVIRPTQFGRATGGILNLLLEQTKDRTAVLKKGQAYEVTMPDQTKKSVMLTNTIVRYQRKQRSSAAGRREVYRHAVLKNGKIGKGVSARVYSVAGTLFNDERLKFKIKRENKKTNDDNRRVVKLYREDFHIFNEKNGWVSEREGCITALFPEMRAKKLSLDVQNAALVMGYVPGIDLFDLIKEQSLTMPQTMNLILLIAKKLKEVHGKGIIHRDLKDENIKVVRDDLGNPVAVYFIDWGLSKFSHKEEGRRYVDGREAERVGSLETVSPEALRAGYVTDEASDVYAIGRIMWTLFNCFDLPGEPRELMDYFKLDKIKDLFQGVSLADLSQAHRDEIEELLLKINKWDRALRPSLDEIIGFFERIKLEIQNTPAAPAFAP